MNLKTYDINDNVKEISLTEKMRDLLERRNYEKIPCTDKYVKQNPQEFEFIKVTSIIYDREKKDTDIQLIDFQQFLSAIANFNGKFAYIIESNEDGINLYLGGSQQFLKDNFEGIYGGSETSFSTVNLNNMNYTKAMLGIPSLKKDSTKDFKQNLERILYPLESKNFRIVLIAESFSLENINIIIDTYRRLKDEVHKLSKITKNSSESNANTEGFSITLGNTQSTSNSTTTTQGYNESTTDKTTKAKIASTGIGSLLSAVIGGGIGMMTGGPLGAIVGGIAGFKAAKGVENWFANETETKGYSFSTSSSQSKSYSTSQSSTKSQSSTNTTTLGISFEEINSNAKYIEDMIDKYIKRYQKGITNGMWRYALYIQAEEEYTLNSLATIIKSVYSGEDSFYEPIRFTNPINIDINTLPIIEYKIEHIIDNSFASFTTPINTEELSILASLPKNDVNGIKVSKISSYGLTTYTKNGIKIGNVLNKKKVLNNKFYINKDTLTSHMFISGITGSGKSNTIKLLLNKVFKEYNIPFLVLEPAKSEYKNLLNDIKDLQYFSPGADDIFKLNPFIFDIDNPNITLYKHIDMLKSVFNAAFPMYASMPYLLEEAIIKIYEDKGWDIDTQDNKYISKNKNLSIEKKYLLFPTMNDLTKKIDEIVSSSGYHIDLESNLKAALTTRIRNLTIGTKGNIFNSLYSLNDDELFSKPTIIELSNITNDEEKTFIMALILNKLYFYIMNKPSTELKHLTVIEEAHRLLPNISLNKSMEESSSKAYAVETFTNILAEVRAFGEGLIIADQIPSKLNPDVIKNTDTKIIHRLTSMDDKNLIGNNINLTKNQILDLSELKISEGIVYNRDLHQAFLVKIDKYEEKEISSKQIKNFRNNFLLIHNYFKYKYMFEKDFYKPECQNEYYKIDSEKFIQFLNAIFAKYNYKAWFEEIKKLNNKKCTTYNFINHWMKLSFISDIKCYQNIRKFNKTYESFIDLIDSLETNDDIEESIDYFLKHFSNYKLIIAENLKREIFVNDLEKLGIEQTIHKYFGNSNIQMVNDCMKLLKGESVCYYHQQ